MPPLVYHVEYYDKFKSWLKAKAHWGMLLDHQNRSSWNLYLGCRMGCDDALSGEYSVSDTAAPFNVHVSIDGNRHH